MKFIISHSYIKVAFALFLFFLNFYPLFGQENKFDVKIGAKLKYSKRSTLHGIVGYDKSGIYSLRTNFLSFKLNLVKYDHDLNEIKSIFYSLEINKEKRQFEDIIQMKGKLYLITSYTDKKSKKNILYCQSINTKTLEINKDSKAIAKIDFSEESRSNSGTFNLVMSRDSSKLLAYYNLPYHKKESDEFGFNVLDENLGLLWHREVTVPYNDQLFDVVDYKVSNSGSIYLLGKVFDEKKKVERNGKPNYTHHIFAFKQNLSEDYEFPINNNDKYFTDMTITADNDDNIICGGFYSSDDTYNISGSYFIKIHGETQKILINSFRDFELDFITQNLSDKSKKKTEKNSEKGKDVGLYSYNLDGIILRDDGGAVLIGEQYYVQTRTSTNPNGGGSISYIYHYNDIIVVNIDPLGQIDWNEKIAKKHSSTNDGGFFLSYSTIVHKDKLHFIFNDNAKNLTLKKGMEAERLINPRNSVVMMVTLDNEGEEQRKSLFSALDTETMARPKVSRRVSEKEFIIYNQRMKIHRFVKITFN